MGSSIWGPYGAHMDVPRWVPDESLLQNPHRSHMGCPYRTHIITHLGPIRVPYSLLAGYGSNTLGLGPYPGEMMTMVDHGHHDF